MVAVAAAAALERSQAAGSGGGAGWAFDPLFLFLRACFISHFHNLVKRLYLFAVSYVSLRLFISLI